ncbi:DUF6320 domain-containing protein [Konateibacter massiliensis]|uniref:DUF6320 domain-containing protein n=1 Tax=Konateibacter massiliensis TaxID=2002841 RepID=UPI00117BA2FA|nr:DUF6320 domain-containing protein [Konateibacter massiliensis]
MKRCNECKVEIIEDTSVCPLCQHGLETISEEKQRKIYPAVEFDNQKFKLLIRIFVFISIILGAGLLTVNIVTYHGVWWSLICHGAIIYFWITVRYSIQNNTNYAAKILVQTIGGMALCFLIDMVVGYQGWSINYAIPTIILAAYLGIVMLMIVNFMSWQSYILFQITLVIFSMILLGLNFLNIITHPVLSYVTAGITLVIFIGTIVFGDKKAKTELIRRFHI